MSAGANADSAAAAQTLSQKTAGHQDGVRFI